MVSVSHILNEHWSIFNAVFLCPFHCLSDHQNVLSITLKSRNFITSSIVVSVMCSTSVRCSHTIKIIFAKDMFQLLLSSFDLQTSKVGGPITFFLRTISYFLHNFLYTYRLLLPYIIPFCVLPPRWAGSSRSEQGLRSSDTAFVIPSFYFYYYLIKYTEQHFFHVVSNRCGCLKIGFFRGQIMVIVRPWLPLV
jgi:hypothetical protein